MAKKRAKKITKRTTKRKSRAIGAVKLKRNPEANINSLIPYKYYILSFDHGYTYPNYRIIIFKDYDEGKIIWIKPISKSFGFDEEEEIEKIWGPFDLLGEAEDYGFRLPKGRWL